jgi:hypothetical protein
VPIDWNREATIFVTASSTPSAYTYRPRSRFTRCGHRLLPAAFSGERGQRDGEADIPASGVPVLPEG